LVTRFLLPFLLGKKGGFNLLFAAKKFKKVFFAAGDYFFLTERAVYSVTPEIVSPSI